MVKAVVKTQPAEGGKEELQEEKEKRKAEKEKGKTKESGSVRFTGQSSVPPPRVIREVVMVEAPDITEDIADSSDMDGCRSRACLTASTPPYPESQITYALAGPSASRSLGPAADSRRKTEDRRARAEKREGKGKDKEKGKGNETKDVVEGPKRPVTILKRPQRVSAHPEISMEEKKELLKRWGRGMFTRQRNDHL